jgi:hypothetical protein
VKCFREGRCAIWCAFNILGFSPQSLLTPHLSVIKGCEEMQTMFTQCWMPDFCEFFAFFASFHLSVYFWFGSCCLFWGLLRFVSSFGGLNDGFLWAVEMAVFCG